MSQIAKVFVGADIHDGTELYNDSALLCFTNNSAEIVKVASLAANIPIHMLAGGIIMPGFVDLQVNGGGGVMFNEHPSVATLRCMANAHANCGTMALLPTLITDSRARTIAAINAVAQAIAEKVPTIIGLHLEGPHLSSVRKGAHTEELIRPMLAADMQVLLDAAARLANVMLTVAPESTTNTQITTLADAGVIVSLGHTDASYDCCMAAFDAGATCVTHLFNAMSQLGNRQPGLVGAALAHGEVYAGIIADGIHVHPATMRVAFAAKPDGGRIFLVTDAMATAGSAINTFMLNNREVVRRDGRLELLDGTLAGADINMVRGISVLVNQVGLSVNRAINSATSLPAQLLCHDFGFGRFTQCADGLIYLDEGMTKATRLDEMI